MPRPGFFLRVAVAPSCAEIKRFKERYNLLVVLGPTASGKTRLAVILARALNGEIISADSRQIYRELDIGTGKEISEYSGAWGSIPLHLIDIIDPDEDFSVFSFQKHFLKAFAEISRRGNFPILAGGTGLYLDSILRRYRMAEVPENKELRKQLLAQDMDSLKRRLMILNPGLHNKTDFVDRKRIIRAIEIAQFPKNGVNNPSPFSDLSPFVIGIRRSREELRQRITLRLNRRIEAGLIDEVRRLHDGGLSWERLDALGLEYRYVGLYLRGEMSFTEMFKVLNTRIHQFAKRQETWFRKMEKNSVVIHWLDNPDPEATYSLIISAANGLPRQ
jgi:tRNA dimethylallyltransferase